MKLNKGIIALLIFTVLCCGAFVAYRYKTVDMLDRKSPVITMSDEIIEVTVDYEDADLLAGITATDDRDGDVTSSLLVERMMYIDKDKVAAIKVAAFDKSGNVAKAERKVKIVDYESPKFTLSKPLVFPEGSTFDAFACISAYDIFDGNISERIKGVLKSEHPSGNVMDGDMVEFRVSNSLGDPSYLEVPIKMYQSGEFNTDVVLDTYLVYIKKDTSFNAREHLRKFVHGATSIDLKDPPNSCNIEIVSNVNPKVCGLYWADYYVDLLPNRGFTRIYVVVEE